MDAYDRREYCPMAAAIDRAGPKARSSIKAAEATVKAARLRLANLAQLLLVSVRVLITCMWPCCDASSWGPLLASAQLAMAPTFIILLLNVGHHPFVCFVMASSQLTATCTRLVPPLRSWLTASTL
jgi:hypothetical protein